MYLRTIHAESDLPSLRQLIHENPLGLLITALDSPAFPKIQCTHIPWVLDPPDESNGSELGVLRGHLARANPHAKALAEVAQDTPTSGALGKEVTVMFNGPAHAYVTPKFYTETKPATGKVVPTWDYAAVQAYGTAVFYDAKKDATASFLHKQVTDLTQHSEEDIMKYRSAWKVTDAPAPYIEQLKKAIVGIEIVITRLEGKYKMSQELSRGDREGVVEGFEALGTEVGQQMARTVKERGALRDERLALLQRVADAPSNQKQ